MELADIDASRTRVRLHLSRIGLELIHTLLQAIHVAAQKHRLGTILTDARLQLKNTGFDLVDIRAQGNDIQVDAVRDGTVDLELATNVIILAIPTVGVAILGQDGGAEFMDARIELVHAVVKVDEGGFGDGRRCHGETGTGHGERGAGAGVAPFESRQGGHAGSG